MNLSKNILSYCFEFRNVKLILIILSSFPSSHVTQTSGWLPPSDSWDSPPGSTLNLPYGWEAAKDKEGATYYVK